MIEKEIDLQYAIPFVRHAVPVPKSRYYTPWRIIYDYEIIFMLDGELIVEQYDKTYTLKKYDFHVMKPFVWHTRYTKDKETISYYNMHFEFLNGQIEEPVKINIHEVYVKPIHESTGRIKVDEKLAQRIVYGLKDIELPEIFHIHDPQRMVSCFERAVHAFLNSNDISSYQLRGMFTYLLGVLFEEMGAEKAKIDILTVISIFKSYVKEKLEAEYINVECFSENNGYSYVYFRNEFRAREGIAPGQYIKQEKIKRATEYLQSGQYTVSNVSDMLGFSSPNNFSVLFKKKTGKSPGEFIRQRD